MNTISNRNAEESRGDLGLVVMPLELVESIQNLSQEKIIIKLII